MICSFLPCVSVPALGNLPLPLSLSIYLSVFCSVSSVCQVSLPVSIYACGAVPLSLCLSFLSLLSFSVWFYLFSVFSSFIFGFRICLRRKPWPSMRGHLKPSGESHVSFCLFLQFPLSVCLLICCISLSTYLALLVLCLAPWPWLRTLSLCPFYRLFESLYVPSSPSLLLSPCVSLCRSTSSLCLFMYRLRLSFLYCCVSLVVWVLRETELELKEEQDAKSKKKRKHNQTNRRTKP